jgi:hypothetical protein
MLISFHAYTYLRGAKAFVNEFSGHCPKSKIEPHRHIGNIEIQKGPKLCVLCAYVVKNNSRVFQLYYD